MARVREQYELLICLRLGLRAPDAERLVLVDELVDDVPQPLFRQLERDGAVRVCRRALRGGGDSGRSLRTQEVVEQLTAVLVRVKAVVNVGLQAGVNMTVVEFAVQNQENLVCKKGWVKRSSHSTRGLGHTIVDKGSDHLRFWPLRLRVELLRQAVPPTLVRSRNLREVVFKNSMVKVYDELHDPSDPNSCTADRTGHLPVSPHLESAQTRPAVPSVAGPQAVLPRQS